MYVRKLLVFAAFSSHKILLLSSTIPTHLSLNVNCLVFLADFNQILDFRHKFS